MLPDATYSIALSPTAANKQTRYLFSWNTKGRVWKLWNYFSFIF